MKYLFNLIILSIISTEAFATDHTVNGEISVMRSHSSYWDSNSWIQIEGVKDVAGCPQDNHGKGYFTYIVVPTEETQLYSMLLSAFITKQNVEVRFSTILTNGLCTIKYASLIQN